MPLADPESSIPDELQDAKLFNDGKLIVAALSKMTYKVMDKFAATLQEKNRQIIKLKSELDHFKDMVAK